MNHRWNFSNIVKAITANSWLIVGLLILSNVGCGRSEAVDENRSSVSGIVTFNGQPLPAGTLIFESKGGLGTTVSILGEGRYTTTRAPIGPNAVGISTESIKYGNPPAYVAIPAKYAEPTTSGLTIDVKPGVNENVNFDLKK